MRLTQRQRLILRKRKIEALLPLVGADRSRDMRLELRKINRALGVSDEIDPKRLLQRPIEGAVGVNGLGGLYFEAESPPGLGRLVRLPFYLAALPLNFPTSVITSAGTGATSSTNPVVIVEIPNGVRSVSGLVLQTPVIEWARLRIVGFQVSQNPFVPTALQADFDLVTNLRPFLLVKDLQVGGGANLLSAEGYIDAAVYSDAVPEFAGIRAYPLLESPNRCTVKVAVSGESDPDAIFGGQLTSLSFSISLICEVLDDSSFGAHIPGPYARKDSMLRTPNPDGGFTER